MDCSDSECADAYETEVAEVEVALAKGVSADGQARAAVLTRALLAAAGAVARGARWGPRELPAELSALACSVTVCDAARPLAGAALVLHVHMLHEEPAARDSPAEGAMLWRLPHAELHGLWESLEFDSSLKGDALRYVRTALALEALGVDPRAVRWSRVLLLHGPPGTGKTSLCRALAHKLSVRLADTYPRACLVEVDAHGLFSKWFSESGKLVTRLFDRIDEIAEDPRTLVCLLIDEVESLAQARAAALAGLEPSDSVRAVNALLTALDRLRLRPNALVLATSNVAHGVDRALLDRADLVRRVPPPGPRAAYRVLRAAAAELQARGAVRPGALFPWRALRAAGPGAGGAARASRRLARVAVAAAAAAVSGRALRRLPLLALALGCAPPPAAPPPLLAWLRALRAALAALVAERAELWAAEGAAGATALDTAPLRLEPDSDDDDEVAP